MNTKIISETTSNNIKIIQAINPKFKNCGALFAFKLGQCSLSEEEYASLHLLEHIILSGNEKYPDPEERFHYKNDYSNGTIDADNTVIWFESTPERFLKNLEIICDLIIHPEISEEKINDEKDIILEEISQNHYDFSSYLIKKTHSIFWPDSKLSRDYKTKTLNNLCTQESIKKIKSKLLQPDNMAIIISTKKKIDGVSEIIENYFCNLKNDDEKYKRDTTPVSQKLPMIMAIPNEQSQYTMNFAYAFDKKLLDEESYTIDILETLLGDEINGILYQKLRKEKKLIYSVETSTVRYNYESIFNIQIEVTQPRSIEVLTMVLDIIQNLAKYIDSKLLEQKKDNYINELKENEDDSFFWLFYLFADALYSNENLNNTFEKQITTIKNIKSNDITKTAKKIFSDNLLFMIFGEVLLEDIKSFELILKESLNVSKCYYEEETAANLSKPKSLIYKFKNLFRKDEI